MLFMQSPVTRRWGSFLTKIAAFAWHRKDTSKTLLTLDKSKLEETYSPCPLCHLLCLLFIILNFYSEFVAVFNCHRSGIVGFVLLSIFNQLKSTLYNKYRLVCFNSKRSLTSPHPKLNIFNKNLLSKEEYSHQRRQGFVREEGNRFSLTQRPLFPTFLLHICRS